MVEEKGRQTADKKEGRKPWTIREFGGQTVWDWLHLLSALAIPVVLAAAGLWFTAQQDHRQEVTENLRARQAQNIEDQRAEAEQELAEQRAQDEALQAYLNQMSSFLLEKDLRESKEDSEVRTLARARTLTVLGRLDPTRKTALMQFLVEADLVQRVDGRDPIISLRGADLIDANLQEATGASLDVSGVHHGITNLRGADLSGAYLNDANLYGTSLDNANLSLADLSGADLSWAILKSAEVDFADLSAADLYAADLRKADLHKASLSDADLSGAGLNDANLRSADLSGAHLSGNQYGRAFVSGAGLNDADLSGADLSGAHLGNGLGNAVLSNAVLDNAILSGAEGITNQELEQQAGSLKGATMPNGQKYEDWLKSKDRKENGKSGGSS
jgi:uncharacterized protein YjbI with pentapeptide repeats